MVDARLLDSEDFAAALELQQRLDRERDPGFAVTGAAELRALFNDDATNFAHHQRIVALQGATAVAMGHLELTSDPANAALATMEITPADVPGSTAVLVQLLERARGAGRTSVIAMGDHTPANDASWTGLGAELRYTEQESCLRLADVDSALMQEWINAAPPDVELLHWHRECPEEWMGMLVAAVNAMNDAPTDDLDMADTIVNAAMMRTEIEARAALGLEYQGILAAVPGTGVAGATEVLVNRHRPDCSWQWNTVVLPDYRGRRIGRWMKAAMWQRLRATEPEVTALQTGNAVSNAQMLAINTAMGFRPTRTTACWQASLDHLETQARQTLGPA
ncbi:hypothetical protein [Candidatus Poriferisocius sp.]|uniref:hypothetical protein n=1 Tax=Candidatus Poriferisocius sp. TaxID=3101276 RepID=UPI003B0251CA